MGRRIRWLGVIMILCFCLLLVQLVNVQFRMAPALANDPNNQAVANLKFDNQRGLVLAADGTVLAKSVRSNVGSYHWRRVYPQGPLYAGITGYAGIQNGIHDGVELTYNQFLTLHPGTAHSIAQLLNKPPPTTDDLTLTIDPRLQNVAAQQLATLSSQSQTGHFDGAIVAIVPQTGAIKAMYSVPTYDPNGLADPDAQKAEAAYEAAATKDAEGYDGLQPIATQEPVAPGSTFKVVTSSAVYNLDPALTNFNFKSAACTPLPQSNKTLCNDGNQPCGGTMALAMLAQSCDPGYGELGIALGGTILNKQAELFGYNRVPPVDLPEVAASNFPPASAFLPQNYGGAGLAYSAIGQQNVTATALQNALVAAGIANNGTVMAPHLMAQVRDAQGNLVTAYQPHAWTVAATPAAAQQVNQLMQGVVKFGTAAQVGFSPSLDAAVKTGTAQSGNATSETNDWMIGFAPANDPKIAVAVVSPQQSVNALGATIAGPMMNAMLTAALQEDGVI